MHLVKDVSRSLVLDCYAKLPGFGERVAMDSTTLKGWVNGGKPVHSDREAQWSVKRNTDGKIEFTLGWKLHLLVDSEYELPIAANVAPGNASDVRRASNILREAREAVKGTSTPNTSWRTRDIRLRSFVAWFGGNTGPCL